MFPKSLICGYNICRYSWHHPILYGKHSKFKPGLTKKLCCIQTVFQEELVNTTFIELLENTVDHSDYHIPHPTLYNHPCTHSPIQEPDMEWGSKPSEEDDMFGQKSSEPVPEPNIEAEVHSPLCRGGMSLEWSHISLSLELML